MEIESYRKEPAVPFERQVTENRHIASFPGGRVEYLRIKPENPEGEPLVYLYGWGATNDAIAGDLRHAFNRNQENITLEPIWDRPPQVSSDDPYSEYTLRNAMAVEQIVKDQKYQSVNLLGHSLGASNVLLSALRLVNSGIKVPHVVIIGPAGFGNPSKIDLTKRWAQMMIQEGKREVSDEKKDQANKIAKMTAGMIARHPRRAIGEAYGVSDVDMSELVARLLRHNVDISIIHAADDPYVHQKDLNTEVQQAAGVIRRERVKLLQDTINTSSITLLRAQLDPQESAGLSPDEIKRRIFEKKARELEKMETDQPLIVPVFKGGHFLSEFPDTYLPLAIDLLRSRTNTFSGLIDSLRYPALPASTGDNSSEYTTAETIASESLRENVRRKIRRSLPRLYSFLPK